MRAPVVTDIALAHRFSAPPGWISDEYAAARSHHGIVYAIEGAAFYRFGSGRKLWLRAGDVLYAPIGSVYTTQCAPEVGFLHMTVNFDLAGGGVFAEPVSFHPDSPLRFEQTLATLVHGWSARHPHHRVRCIGHLYELIYLLLRALQSPPPQHAQRLRPARDYLDAHFDEAFDLESLPQLCNMSPTYFRRLFHSVFHETPVQYRRRLRIARAVDLLLTGQYSIAEIAAACGYPDPAYFSRVFHQTMGLSPSEYARHLLAPDRQP